MSVFSKTIIPSLLILASFCAGTAQQQVPSPAPPLGRLHGRITAPLNSVARGTTVTVSGKGIKKTVTVNDYGDYDFVLPTGRYDLVATAPKSAYLREYVRRGFSVSSARTIVFNGVLQPARVTCDIRVGNTSSPPVSDKDQLDAIKDLCGGSDEFTVPAVEGLGYQLYIQYPKRVVIGTRCSYTSVFIAYNLFSMMADNVSYNPATRILEANGNITMANASGATRHANSATVTLEEDGTVRSDEH